MSEIKESWTDQSRVDTVMRTIGCTTDEARDYLIAEEGDCNEAIISIEGDRSFRTMR